MPSSIIISSLKRRKCLGEIAVTNDTQNSNFLLWFFNLLCRGRSFLPFQCLPNGKIISVINHFLPINVFDALDNFEAFSRAYAMTFIKMEFDFAAGISMAFKEMSLYAFMLCFRHIFKVMLMTWLRNHSRSFIFRRRCWYFRLNTKAFSSSNT